jgi:hypothetical protein
MRFFAQISDISHDLGTFWSEPSAPAAPRVPTAELLLVVHDQGRESPECLGRQACRAHRQTELDTHQQVVAAVPGMPIARDSISSGRYTAVGDQVTGAPVQVMDDIGGHGPYGAIPDGGCTRLEPVPGPGACNAL